jgi:transposase
MTLIPRGAKVHLAVGYTDMRKGIDGLAMLVQAVLHQDPFSGHLFVFRGRKAQQPTFCIPFSFCDGRLSLASVVQTDVAGLAVSSRQRIDLHLHGQAA